MNAKEVKEQLKCARDLIKSKQFDESLKICQNILEGSTDNYIALVYSGACLEGLQRSNEALQSYKKASQLDSSQSLAWQGICSIFEKSGDKFIADRTELSAAYKALIDIFKSDDKKCCEIDMKLCHVYEGLKEYDECFVTCERIIQYSAWSDVEEQKRLAVYCLLCRVIPLISHSTPQSKTLLENSCQTVINSTSSVPNVDKELCYVTYIKLLVERNSDVEEIWKVCEQSTTDKSSHVFQWELMCNIYLDCVTEKNWELSRIESVIESLESHDADNASISLIKGYKLMMSDKPAEAKPLLMSGIKKVKNCASALLYYGKCLQTLHQFQEAIQNFDKGIQLIKNERCFGDRDVLRASLTLHKCECLVYGSNVDEWKAACDLCLQYKKTDRQYATVQYLLARAYIKMDQLTEAKQIIDEMESSSQDKATVNLVTGLWFMAQDDFNNATERFQNVVDNGGAQSMALQCLGVLCWRKLENNETVEVIAVKESCFKYFIQAAKFDPYAYENFLYLGRCYQSFSKDVEKALRCYRKAFDLNSSSEESGASLIDCLRILQKEDEALSLLQTITQSYGESRGKWAWLRLGLYYLNQNDANAAISALQAALRQDSKDSQCWECLGEAYMMRGSYTAAVKALTRATVINPTAVHSLYQLAVIKLKQSLHREAIEKFTAVLLIEKDYIPALKGCGEALILLARSYLSNLLYEMVIDSCEAAIDHLTRAAKLKPSLTCIWKLLGDSCTILHPISTALLRIKVPGRLMSEKSENNVVAAAAEEEVVVLDKKQLLALGARCYGMALKLRPEVSSLWHDLGVNYYYQSCAEDSLISKVTISKSVQTLQHAVSLNPTNHAHWLTLGVVTASKDVEDYSLAQHCFIKSLMIEPNAMQILLIFSSSELSSFKSEAILWACKGLAQYVSQNAAAWTNLGTLYLLNGKTQLAHEAFKKAQSIDPSYVNCWIGQAYIAEQIGDHDTMDLFRHTTEFSTLHVEALLGYSHHVCLTLQDQSKMSQQWYQYAVNDLHAVCAASDAMAKYTACVSDDANGWNTLSLLLERQNLLPYSLKCLKRACDLADKASVTDAVKSAIYENYARLLVKSEDYERALKIFEAQPTILNSYSSLCCYALALSKTGKQEASSEVYKKALDTCSDEEVTSRIHIALGLTAYKCGNTNDALTSLFSCVKYSKPAELGLCALLSLAFLQRDIKLINAVMKELNKHQLTHPNSTNIVLLKALIKLAQGMKTSGVGEVQKLIHRYPHMTSHWITLAQFLMSHTPELSSAARDCCMIALRGQCHNLHEGYQYLCRALQSTSSTKEAFRAAQKAVHLFPDSLSSWCLLLATCHSENIERIIDERSHLDLQATTLSLSTHLMSRVESDMTHAGRNKKLLQSLNHWSARQHILTLLVANRLQPAQSLLNQAVWLYDKDTLFSSLSAYLSKDTAALSALSQQDSDSILCQIFLHVYLDEEKATDAQKVFNAWLKLTRECRNVKAGREYAFQLLKLHMRDNNTSDIKELLKFAKKENDTRMLDFYEKNKSS